MKGGVIVGSGPNGLAAGIVLAQAGLPVTVLEAAHTAGGGTRSGFLTLPGFLHDICSAVHPLAVSSPFFRSLPLAENGLEWIHPEAPMAHPLDDGTAVLLERSIEATCAGLGEDGELYRARMAPLLADWKLLVADMLGPPRFPRHPLALARFGLFAIRDAFGLAREWFRGERARALFAGLAAHSILPLERPLSAAAALLLGLAGHAVGWPIPRGGSQRIAYALISHLAALGGAVRTSSRVDDVDDLDGARLVLCDVTPRQLLEIAGHRLTAAYREKLARYRYGPGVYKMDWALDAPIPWRAKECARAATVHLGGTLEEIAESERAPWKGEPPARPFVLLAQPSLFDETRAPSGKHTAWAYCHVPNGSAAAMEERIEAQVERFAPGFRDRILARSVMGPAELERRNANLVGGDIAGGAMNLAQFFLRPTVGTYSTPCPGLYLCSSSTPPGAAVHGMCGYYAARRALRDLRFYQPPMNADERRRASAAKDYFSSSHY